MQDNEFLVKDESITFSVAIYSVTSVLALGDLGIGPWNFNIQEAIHVVWKGRTWRSTKSKVHFGRSSDSSMGNIYSTFSA